MKFRVSMYSHDKFDPETSEELPPCPGAVAEVSPRWDRRTFETEAEHDARFGGEGAWRAVGREHGTWQNGIAKLGIRRLLDHEVWTLEVDSVEQLVELAHSEGFPIEVDTGEAPELPTLKIVNGWD